jgi:hypothetical protein
MSSSLKILSSNESVPLNLTGLEMIQWTLYHVSEDEIASCKNDKIYLDLSELPWDLYKEFKYTIDKLINNEFRGTQVLIPTAIMQSLWNKHTLVIQHQRLGPFTKQQWIEYCKTVEFFVYVT